MHSSGQDLFLPQAWL